MIDFLSSPFSLVSVGLGVLAIAIIGIVVWILSIDRRTRGMVDSLEQERRKVAEMQVFLSRRGNDGARRTPRAPQSGAAVGARPAGTNAVPCQSRGEQPQRPTQSAPSHPTQGAAAVAAQQYSAAASTVVPTGQSAAGAAYFHATAGADARSRVGAARAAAGVTQEASVAAKPEKQRSRGGRGAMKVPYGEDKTGGAGYAGLDQSSDARARAEQAARIRQQAAREAQMRAQQQAQASAAHGAQAAVAGGGYTVAARGGAVTGRAATSHAVASAGYAVAATQAAGTVSPSVQTPAGVRYVPSDPNYRPAGEAPRVKAHPTYPDGFDGTVRTSDAHGRPADSSAQIPYDQRGAQRPANPAEGKPSMPWSTPAEPRGRHAR